MYDPHSELAIELFGDASPENRQKAKEINYMRFYSAGEIKVSLVAGMYPIKERENES